MYSLTNLDWGTTENTGINQMSIVSWPHSWEWCSYPRLSNGRGCPLFIHTVCMALLHPSIQGITMTTNVASVARTKVHPHTVGQSVGILIWIERLHVISESKAATTIAVYILIYDYGWLLATTAGFIDAGRQWPLGQPQNTGYNISSSQDAWQINLMYSIVLIKTSSRTPLSAVVISRLHHLTWYSQSRSSKCSPVIPAHQK